MGGVGKIHLLNERGSEPARKKIIPQEIDIQGLCRCGWSAGFVLQTSHEPCAAALAGAPS
jgi:hypothetical protein